MEKLLPWLRRSSAVLRPKTTRLYSTGSSILSTPQSEDVHFKFWMQKVDPKLVFYSTELSFAMMNIRPLCPDVLVCPRREVMLSSDLTSEEVDDLCISMQKIGVQVKNYHGASSVRYVKPGGQLAGQIIPHVHIHIIPRVARDWKDTENLFDAICENLKELRKTIDKDVQLAGWADQYRRLFSTNLDDSSIHLDDSSIHLDDSDSDMDFVEW